MFFFLIKNEDLDVPPSRNRRSSGSDSINVNIPKLIYKITKIDLLSLKRKQK